MECIYANQRLVFLRVSIHVLHQWNWELARLLLQKQHFSMFLEGANITLHISAHLKRIIAYMSKIMLLTEGQASLRGFDVNAQNLLNRGRGNNLHLSMFYAAYPGSNEHLRSSPKEVHIHFAQKSL